ncbi:DUF4250 domain-containing protein [Vibrio methylphosphonaticus]|uniref:DUF4250 domain-containing protein n=1 Tax=Vibrio methylphosphonaticus TaxID=2946866 RepID=UPI002029CBD6|nr:DUF4250 domain-containing protein [Vibrio methylphosphonaticus]MCL9773155.1 DUF4250 domain-containing protein [Vibrio methylphosphonaticus]
MNLANFATMDTIMLMSIINMKLRDDFNGNLEELCATNEIDKQALIDKLSQAGFDYLAEIGQFR